MTLISIFCSTEVRIEMRSVFFTIHWSGNGNEEYFFTIHWSENGNEQCFFQNPLKWEWIWGIVFLQSTEVGTEMRRLFLKIHWSGNGNEQYFFTIHWSGNQNEETFFSIHWSGNWNEDLFFLFHWSGNSHFSGKLLDSTAKFALERLPLDDDGD